MARGLRGSDGSTGPVQPRTLTAVLHELARAPDAEQGAAWREALRAGAQIGRFELVRELGRGGMGMVWEARDRELGRSVAFKAVRAGGDTALREERLLREAEAAARLSHPNIVTLFDVGRCPHGPYLVLELLHGETLAAALRGGRRVPAAEAVRIAREVARGLAHAHAEGVVHRDLKPGNVFLCRDGQVKILDFGLAHAFGRRLAGGGTPAYMAPEQRAGAPEDERSDVYALGVMLHEMLSGELPHAADERWRELPGLRPRALSVPDLPALGELVTRMMERDPLRRPRDGEAVLAALSRIREGLGVPAPDRRLPARTRWRPSARLLGAAAGLALALVAGAAALTRLLAPPRGAAPMMVAVADFANETRDPDLDGLSGLLITSLEQSKKLRVLTRGRMLDLAREVGGRDTPLVDESLARSVGRKAKVRTLLFASIRKLGDVYTTELRAVDPQRDEYLFTIREQATAKSDLLPLIDRVSERVRLALRESTADVTASGVRVGSAVTANLEAYRHYFRGKELAARGRLDDAVAQFARAVELEPDFALARLEVAWIGYFGGLETRIEARDLVRRVAAAAVRPPEKEAGITRVLGTFFDGRFAASRAETSALIARFPEDPDVAVLGAEVLTWCGETEGAIPVFELALQLAPDWDFIRMDLVTLRNYAGQPAIALSEAEEAAARRPLPLARVTVGVARYMKGDIEGGVAAIRASGADAVIAQMLLGEGLAALGRVDEALAIVAGLDHAVADLTRAQVLAYAGRLREGTAALDAAAKRPGADVSFNRQATAWYLAAAGDIAGARRALAQGDFFTVLDGTTFAALDDGRRLRTLLAEVGPETGFYGRLLRALELDGAGDHAGALTDLRALDRGGGSFAAYHRGAVAAALGLDAEAVEALGRFCDALLWGSDAYPAPWLVARGRYLMARSLERLGRRDEARKVLDLQLARWKQADPDLPLLADMKALRARLGTAQARPKSAGSAASTRVPPP